MLALVVVGGGQAQGEALIVSEEDAQATAKSTSRLTVGTHIFRKDALHLALMASENRAAHLLARTYPGGTEAAVAAMNETARQLGMLRTHFVEPTGLSEQNISSATDLARLVARASHEPLIRADSTDTAFALPEGRREVAYHTTNKLLLRPEWDILVQKTGYIVEAGRCVALEARVAGRAVIIVLLHARSPGARLSDATRIHQWLDRAAARI
jgi:D-alanyl-D-alanine endopeptidase (penicillin-binding protein 7)